MKSYGRSGRRYRYEPPDCRGQGALEFWAENGMVCMVDERLPAADANHFHVLSVREFLTNLRSINASIERCANGAAKVAAGKGASAGGAAAEMRDAMSALVANGIACAREAKHMGDPLNPEHARDMIKERRKRMLYAGGKAEGAISAALAPEAGVLPPLLVPGRAERPPPGKIILP